MIKSCLSESLYEHDERYFELSGTLESIKKQHCVQSDVSKWPVRLIPTDYYGSLPPWL